VKKRRITLVRRLVQTVLFLLLLYGAFIWEPVRSPLPSIEPGTPKTTLYRRDQILWVSSQESVIELYLPVLACRFIARGGTFKSCSLHVLSENITWKTPIKVLLPHLTFVAILSFLFARAWCAWTCPLGAMQDAMSWIRRKLGAAPWHLSAAWRSFLNKTRHFLLWFSLVVSAVIAIPALGGTGVNDALFLFYCQLCPSRLVYPPLGGVNPCWYDFSTGLTMFLSFIGWIMLGVFALCFVVPRLWCRICAVGALLSYFNRGGLTTLEKKAGKCTSCGTCRRVCPVDVQRVYRERRNPVVTDPQCTLCARCVEACPEDGCLSLRFAGKRLVES
jgi:ferredoxin-type protein NapH